MQIIATNGKPILVDDNEYEYLSKWKWGIYSGYAVTSIKGKGH
jgi:hypothetical protein